MVEEVLEKEETMTLEQMRQKLVEMGAKKIDTVQKIRGPIPTFTLEFWELRDGDEVEQSAILQIYPSGKYKLFNLLEPSDYV
jgi:hypothetical protein